MSLGWRRVGKRATPEYAEKMREGALARAARAAAVVDRRPDRYEVLPAPIR